MSGWKTLSSEEVYKTPWIRVRRDEIENHMGEHLTYSVVELEHPSVFIVALTANNEILIQREYKYPVDNTLWSIPAGHSDGEELLAAAKRELLEETGLESEDWTDLGLFHQSTGIGNLPYKAFLARNVRETTNTRDEQEEIIEQKFIPLEEIEHMITSGEFYDTPAVAAVYAARIHGLSPKQPTP